VSKQHPKAKHLPQARNALAKIRTTQATLDAARRAAEQEGVSLSHWIELTLVARLNSTPAFNPAESRRGLAATLPLPPKGE
jgi:hypothetical protein